MQLPGTLAVWVLAATTGLGLAAFHGFAPGSTTTSITTSTTDICHCTTTTLSSATTTVETTTSTTMATSTSTTRSTITTSTSTSMPSTTSIMTPLTTSTVTTSTVISSTSTTTSTVTTTTRTTTTSVTGSTTTRTTTTSTTSSTTLQTSTSTTRTTTTTCPPCGYFVVTEEEVRKPGIPSGFVCGTDCASLSWDFVTPMIMMSVLLWGGMLVGGVALFFYSVTSNVDDMKERVEVWHGKLQSSYVFCMIYMTLACAQCIMFSVRTFSKSVNLVGFSIELLAVACFLLNLTLSWMQAYMKSVSAGVAYTITWGVVDALLIPSVICLCLIEDADGVKSWFSLSFVAAVHIFESWRWLIEIRRLDLRVLKWQAMDVLIPFLVIVFFSGMMMMSLENLGDPEWILDLNEERWTVISSLYFVFVTISTVGYGDIAPVTTLGRLFAIIAIFGGISAFLNAMHQVLTVMNLRSAGGGHFTPRVRVRHIVVTGNPTVGMATDFISELFHPDHAEDAEDLHLVLMLPRGSACMSAVLKFLKQRQNLHIAPRVHVLQGSVLERNDLQRVCPKPASSFFVLPNIQCTDQMHEDTENIIRMMAVLKVAPKVRMILLLMKAEHEQLLHDTGVGDLSANLTCLAMDQFKFELVGKSCLVPGFGTMICNLFKTIGDAEEDTGLEKVPGMAWIGDYDNGCGNELYEVELSTTYASRGAVFSEVVLDVIEQTDGKVYLIGLVETGLGQKRVLVNPGTFYPIKKISQGVQTSGIFIAADRDCVIQCDGGVFLGRRERPAEKKKDKGQDSETRSDGGSRPGSASRPGSRERSRSRDKNAAAGKELVPVNGEQTGKSAATGKEQNGQSAGTGKEIVPASPPPESPPPPPKDSPEHAPQKPGSRSKAVAAELARQDAAKQKREQQAMRAEKRREVEDHNTAFRILMLAEQQRKALQPHRPPLKLLSKGGHVLFLCVGTHAGDELRLGVEHFLRPMRLASAGVEMPLVVLAPVPPRDWHRVSEAKQVYFMKGSPLSIFDLERANFRACSVIFVCHVGTPRSQITEEWQVDSEVVCCLRLIESEIPWGSPISIIVEVTVDTNHSFVALTTQPPGSESADSSGGTKAQRFHRRAYRASDVQLQLRSPAAVQLPPEYYRQPRFACGQLFVGNVVTSLVVNTFYNPSLWELIHTMISSQVMMVPVPKLWEGKSYYEYFDHLLRQQELMPVAVYRLAEAPRGSLSGKQPRRWSYVFTAPPAKETHMVRGDSVICFGVGAGGMASHRE